MVQILNKTGAAYLVEKIKALISDKMGHIGSAASARGSASSLSLSAGTITNITLNTWITRTDTQFTFSGGGIKCPYDGVVMISGSVYVPLGSDSYTGGCYIKKGTTEISSQYITGIIGGVAAAPVIISVSAGDIIYLCARRSNAGTCMPSNAATHLDIMYID